MLIRRRTLQLAESVRVLIHRDEHTVLLADELPDYSVRGTSSIDLTCREASLAFTSIRLAEGLPPSQTERVPGTRVVDRQSRVGPSIDAEACSQSLALRNQPTVLPELPNRGDAVCFDVVLHPYLSGTPKGVSVLSQVL